MGFGSRLAHGWNAFLNRDQDFQMNPFDAGPSTSNRPDRPRLRFTNERSMITSIMTRIAVDCAAIDIRHVRLDDQNRYISDEDSGLNNCLTVEANIDQAARHFRQDAVMTLLDKGTIALVPVDTSEDPEVTGSYDIQTMRVGEIVQWYPRKVRIDLYNDQTGRHEQVILPKRQVAIVENPLYNVMNGQNSTLQRLVRKLNLLDTIDEQSGSGKLDIIIQLPYVTRTETKRDQAEKRRKDMEFQLKDSQYGIAYTDANEKITQLNRPAENNLLKQIEMLTEMVYGQLGITVAVMNGTAEEAEMLSYNNRTVEPILGAFAEAMKRSFLTKTARTQKQSIEYFRDPFKLVPMKDLAEMADKFTRNEIITSNEFRGFIGMKPSSDPKADKLINSNMPQPSDGSAPVESGEDSAAVVNSAFDEVDASLDEVFAGLGIPLDDEQ